MATSELQNYEMKLSNSSFLHGRNLQNQNKSPCLENKEPDTLLTTNHKGFRGIRLDTCSNRTSVMGVQQYRAYCMELQIMKNTKPVHSGSINGIGGGLKTVRIVLVKIPFMDLKLVISVEFPLLKADIPSLLSMKDMKNNGLDISLQRETIN